MPKRSLPVVFTVVFIFVLAAAAPASSQAQVPRWQVGSFPSVSSGRYGTDAPTTVVYTPVTVRRLFEDGDLTFVVPMTCIRGTGTVRVVGGQPLRTEAPGVPADPARGNGRVGEPPPLGRPAAGDSLRPGAGALAVPVTECGPGDIVVRGRYYLLDERGWLPTIAVRAHAKLPTASAERGLGTGRPDEGVGVEVTRTVGPGFFVMADGGYTVVGRPDDVVFQNTWWYDLGVSQSLMSDRVSLSIFFEEYRAIVPGLANARDLLAVVSVTSRAGWRWQAAATVGLSSGAPDLGLTVGASRRF